MKKYGLLKHCKKAQIIILLNKLIGNGYLDETDEFYILLDCRKLRSRISLSEKGMAMMKERRQEVNVTCVKRPTPNCNFPYEKVDADQIPSVFSLDKNGSLIAPEIPSDMISTETHKRLLETFPIVSNNDEEAVTQEIQKINADEMFLKDLASDFNLNTPLKNDKKSQFNNTSYSDFDDKLDRRCKLSSCNLCKIKSTIENRNADLLKEIEEWKSIMKDGNVMNTDENCNDLDLTFLYDICSVDTLKSYNGKVLTLIDGYPHSESRYKYEGDVDVNPFQIPVNIFKESLYRKADGSLRAKEGIENNLVF